MSSDRDHRLMREQLGAYALGGLPELERLGVRAHLDGCSSCRAELAEIEPLADDLRTIDLTQLLTVITPPADLGERIQALVAQESEWKQARAAQDERRDRRGHRRRTLRSVVAAAAVIAMAFTGGLVVERAQDGGRQGVRVPTEALSLTPVGTAGVTVTKAALIPHTWGVEVRMAGSGFVEGAVYRASFSTKDGVIVPAGEFLGTGSKTITCNLQAATLRPATTTFVISDARGAAVLSAELPAAS